MTRDFNGIAAAFHKFRRKWLPRSLFWLLLPDASRPAAPVRQQEVETDPLAEQAICPHIRAILQAELRAGNELFGVTYSSWPAAGCIIVSMQRIFQVRPHLIEPQMHFQPWNPKSHGDSYGCKEHNQFIFAPIPRLAEMDRAGYIRGPRRGSAGRKGAFTRSELAVTLAIIGVLWSIVYPVTHRARWSNLTSSCQTNLKQIGQGFSQYAQDYDDRLPRLKMRRQPVTKPVSSGWVNALQPYLRSFKVFQCPSESHWGQGNTDYAYNSWPLAGCELSRFKNASTTVLMCECAELPGAMASASGPIVIDRHQGHSNYCFLDGHVKWLGADNLPVAVGEPTGKDGFTFGT